MNNPLYPVLPAPVVFLELLTFVMLTLSPTLILCAISVVTMFFVESLASVAIPAIILGLRLSMTSESWVQVILKSDGELALKSVQQLQVRQSPEGREAKPSSEMTQTFIFLGKQ